MHRSLQALAPVALLTNKAKTYGWINDKHQLERVQTTIDNPHFDHSGGLRTYVAEGATIVTHESNKGFFDKALASSRTLSPDRQSRNPRRVKVRYAGAKTVLSDGDRVVESMRAATFL